jgi:hypothetical protein
MVEKKSKRVHLSKVDLSTEIGQIVAAEDIKHDLKEWIEAEGDNAEKMLLIWVDGKEGMLHLFGSNMKAVEAVGYLEVAKADLLDYMYSADEEGEGL